MLNKTKLQIKLLLSGLDMFIYGIKLTPVYDIKVGTIA